MGRQERTSSRDEEATGRKARVPLGLPRQRLKTNSDLIPPGKKGRWISDIGNRITDALEGGYQLIPSEDAVVGEGPENQRVMSEMYVSKVVGVDRFGKPHRQFLMMIDKELHEQDQQAKQKMIDQTEHSITRGADPNTLKKPDGRYVPEGGIQVQHGLARK
jgi:hypothetical protein